MKRILLLLILCVFALPVYSVGTRDQEYYKNFIKNQRILFNVSGLINSITSKKDKDLVEAFMKAGMSPNVTYMGNSVMFYAIQYKQPESLDILIKNGANVEEIETGRTMLCWAIYHKSSDAVGVLIKNDVDVNRIHNNTIPLNYAISTKQTRIVEMLLEAGAKPDAKTFKLAEKSKNEYIKDLVQQHLGGK